MLRLRRLVAAVIAVTVMAGLGSDHAMAQVDPLDFFRPGNQKQPALKPAVQPNPVPDSVPSLPSTDGDVIKTTKNILTDVELAENEVVKSFGELTRRLDQFNPQVPKSEKDTLDAFHRFLDKMQTHGKRLAEAEPEFKAAVRRYEKALERGPKAYRNAADLYVKRATDEKFEDLKKEYLDLAKAAKETATDLEKRRGDLAINVARVSSSLEWVSHAMQLLDAMNQFLDLIPEPSQAAAIAKFADSIERFSGNFRAAVTTFREVHDRRLGASAAPVPVPIAPRDNPK